MLHSEPLARAVVANHLAPADRDLLTRREEGRLSYTSGKGHPTVVVAYTVRDGHLVIRVPEYSELAWYVPGSEVTLTVDGDQIHPGAVQLRRTAEAGRQQTSELDPRAEHWPEWVNITDICLPLAEFQASGRRFDLMDFKRAIDTGDADSQIAAYDDWAEVEVIDPDDPTSSPHVIKGKNAIACWVRSNCQKNVRQHVVRTIEGSDAIAYTVSQVQRDGSQQIATSTAELRNGLVTQQQTILVRYPGNTRQSAIPAPDLSEAQRAMAL